MSYKTCPNCYSSNVTYVEGDSETFEKVAAYTGAILGDILIGMGKKAIGFNLTTKGLTDCVREHKWGTPNYWYCNCCGKKF